MASSTTSTVRRPFSMLRSGVGSMGLRVGNMLLSLLTSVVLARLLQPDGYGDYSYVIALMTLLTIPAQLGLPTLVVREVAKYQLQKRWGLLRGLLVRANQAVLGFSLLLLLAAGGVLLALPEPPRLFYVYLPALALVPLISLGLLRGAALRGLRYIVLGQAPEYLLRPTLFLVLIVVFLQSSGSISASAAMTLHVISAFVAFLAGAWLLFRYLPRPVLESPAEFQTNVWLTSAIPLSLLSAVQVINSKVDIVMLGVLGSPADVGIYRLATQAGLLVALVFNAATVVLGPNFSRLYTAGNTEGLQRLVTRSTRYIFLLSLPVAAGLVLFGGPLLAIVFGSAYESGNVALAILAIGQLFNAAMGPVASLLNMTGNERSTVSGVTTSAVLNTILNVILIPRYGIAGAAIATSVSLATWNVILAVLAYRRTGVVVSLAGRPS